MGSHEDVGAFDAEVRAPVHQHAVEQSVTTADVEDSRAGRQHLGEVTRQRFETPAIDEVSVEGVEELHDGGSFIR